MLQLWRFLQRSSKLKTWIPQRQVQASSMHQVEKVTVTMTFDRQPPPCNQFIFPLQYVYTKLSKLPESILEMPCMKGSRCKRSEWPLHWTRVHQGQEFLCGIRGFDPNEPEMIGALLGGYHNSPFDAISASISAGHAKSMKRIISQLSVISNQSGPPSFSHAVELVIGFPTLGSNSNEWLIPTTQP